MHRKVAAALVAALALGIASCGGGEQTLTRAELVRKIETACREGQREATSQLRASRRSSSPGESSMQFLMVVLTNQKVVIEKISDLKAEGAAKSGLDAYKQAVQARIDLLERVKAAGTAGIERAIRAEAGQAESVTRRAQEAARALGLRGCI